MFWCLDRSDLWGGMVGGNVVSTSAWWGCWAMCCEGASSGVVVVFCCCSGARSCRVVFVGELMLICCDGVSDNVIGEGRDVGRVLLEECCGVNKPPLSRSARVSFCLRSKCMRVAPLGLPIIRHCVCTKGIEQWKNIWQYKSKTLSRIKEKFKTDEEIIWLSHCGVAS